MIHDTLMRLREHLEAMPDPLPDRDELYDGTGYGLPDGGGELFGIAGAELEAHGRNQDAIEPTHASHMAMAVGAALQEDNATKLPDLVLTIAATALSWMSSLDTYNSPDSGHPTEGPTR